MTDTDLPVEFDHHSANFAEHRDEILRELRGQCAVVRTDQYGGFYIATTYETARRVLRDDGAFTVEKVGDGPGGILIPATENPHLVPGEVDGTPHAAYRRVLNPLFSRKTIETLRPVIERIARKALDEIEMKGHFDAVADFGTVIPLELTFDYLGIFGVGDRLDFLLEIEREFYSNSETLDQKWSEWVEIVKQTRDSGNGGVMDTLGRCGDPKFSDDELVSLMLSAVMGGVRTTAAAIAHGIWYLDKNKELRERLRADPSLVPAAVEEFMRYFSPAAGVARTAKRDIDLGTVTLHAGDRVLASIHSGNHDEAVYSDPDTLDIDRPAFQNLAFGAGKHLCLGIWLTRLEMEVAFSELLERFPHYQIDHENSTRWEDLGVLNVWSSMPATTR